MGRKIKNLLALIVVIVMLYHQQSSWMYEAYAGDGTAGNESTKDNVSTKEDNWDAKEELADSSGNSAKEGDGEDEKTEEDGESGEDTGNEDDESGKGDGENPPEDEPIECFQITIPAEDGDNGYYVTKPEVTITHISRKGVTKYRFTDGNGQITEGGLKECDEKASIEKEKFQEGANHLSVWMEDEEGNRVEGYALERVFMIDTIAPVLQIQTPMGLEAWYQKEVFVAVSGEDGERGSQIAQISCCQGGQLAETSNREKTGFIITAVSIRGKAVPVVVKAYDRAGNYSERALGLYIDSTPPGTFIDGVQDYMITSQPVEVNYRVEEENLIASVYAGIQGEDPQGKVSVMAAEEWRETGTGISARQTLTEDGIYRIEMEARDRAGHVSGSKAQVIIDKTNPIICNVDRLDGQYIQNFCWDDPAERWIRDFTSYTYSISLDGKPYHIGEEVSREGGHVLEVRAVDAAGNEGVARADFVIDHTPPKVIYQGLEEGTTYEEEVKFQISLKNQEDSIDEIRINGVRQKMNSGNQNCQYQAQECKDYEIQVKASDKAGNKTTSRICFQVVEKESILQKITRPLMERITGKKTAQKGQTIQDDTETGETILIIIVASGAAIAVAAGICWYLRKRKRSKE